MLKRPLLLAVALCGPATADPQAELLLKRVGELYRTAESYHFVAREQTVTVGQGTEKRVRLVAMTARDEEGRTRVEFDDRVNGGAAIDDGVNRWVYVPSAKKYAKLPSAEADQPNVPGLNFSAVSKRFTDRYSTIGERVVNASVTGTEKQPVNEESVECVVVEVEYAPPPGLRNGKINRRFWIGRQSLIVVREHSTASMDAAQDGTRVTVTQDIYFDTAHAGEHVARQVFRFVPPPGVRLVESFNESAEGPRTSAEDPAPDFSLNDFDGARVQLSSLRGKVVLLDFWATWCGPCRYDMPFVQQLYEELNARGLEVYGVNSEGSGKAANYLNQFGLTFPNLIDRDMAVARLYRVLGIPTFVVIDRQGHLSSYMRGTRSKQQLRSAIMKAGL